MYIKSLEFLSWNIQGIKSKAQGDKLISDEFIEAIKNKHIVALTETHSVKRDTLSVPGYVVYKGCRPTKKDKGGVAFLIHASIKKGVTFISSTTCDLIWCKLSKDFFNFPNNIYVACFYASPVNSNWHVKNKNIKPYEVLELDVTKFNGLGSVILLGDFNARVGDRNELGQSNI